MRTWFWLLAFFVFYQKTSLNAQTLKEEYTQCAVNFVQTKQYSEAVEYFSRVIELDSMDLITYFDRGFTKELMNDFEGAIADFSLQISIDSSSTDSYFLRGMVKERIGDTLGAIADYSKVIGLEYDNADAHFFKGRGFATYDNWKAALNEYSIAITINPEHGLAYAYRAWVLIEMGNKKAALKDLEWSEKYEPNLALCFILKAVLFAEDNEFNLAFSAIEHASLISIPLNLNYPKIPSLKQKMGGYKLVVTKRLADMKGEHVSDEELLHFAIAAAFVQQEELALQVVEEILTAHPTQEEAIRMRAKLNAGKRMWNSALIDLNMLLNTDSPNPEDYLMRAKVHANLNHTIESCEDYRRYLMLSSAVVYESFWRVCKLSN